MQDLRLGHVRHFGGVVGILDARTSGGQVGGTGFQVADYRVEAVQGSTQGAALGVNLADSSVDSGDGSSCCRGATHANTTTGHAQSAGGDGSRTDGQLVVAGGASANLNGQGAGGVQQADAVEVVATGDTVDFRDALRNFGGDGTAVDGAIGITRSLHGELTDALQVVVDLVQAAFHGLDKGDTVVGVTTGLVHASDLAGHTVGDRFASGIVLGAIDAQAGGQALHGGLQSALGLVQVALSDQGSDVRVDNSHAEYPLSC